MTLMRCCDCDNPINTDDDPNCFYDPNWHIDLEPWNENDPMCEWCRDDRRVTIQT